MCKALNCFILAVTGNPPDSLTPIGDVAAGDWYYEAIAWADGADIVSGYGGGSFGPGDSITREQLAAILYRYAAAKGVSVAEHTDLTVYDDYDDISPYALDALSWACAEGLMTGRTGSTIDPQGTATRAEAAAIFMRFDENII